ncbi:MAG: SpoIIE family protein phosphatase [Bacillota bacterium]|nr:SpoIIE family protein phosphatase [Bacillota bacterium]
MKESEEKYKQIINSIPNAVIITQDKKIVLVNNKACELIGKNYNKIIESDIYDHIPIRYVKVIHKKIKSILKDKKSNIISEYDFKCSADEQMNVQISSSYIIYKNKPAVLSNIIDITEMKKDLNKAANFQRNFLQKCFPIIKKANMAIVYVPAKVVSGDFYRLYKIDENLVIGIIADIRGKGIIAALSISAFDVLFFQEVSVTHEPINIIKNLNEKLVNYNEENYIAACCFSIDFNKNELNVSSAGINQFIFHKKGQSLEVRIAEGTYLGMFQESVFDEQIISFESDDRFIFFTDGMDFILDEDKVIQKYLEKVSISKFKKYMDEFLNDTLAEFGSLKDDCTMIELEMK